MLRSGIVLLSLLLAGCGGSVVYDRNSKIYIGHLDENVNQMTSEHFLIAKPAKYETARYGMDSAGAVIGVCRNDHGQYWENAEMDFSIFSPVGVKKFYLTEYQMAGLLDGFFGGGTHRWMARNGMLHCDKIGGSGEGSQLVVYMQPQTIGDVPPQNIAALLEVRPSGVILKGAEHWDRGGSPSSYQIVESDLKGNTIDVVNGELMINGSNVVLNNSNVLVTGKEQGVSYVFR